MQDFAVGNRPKIVRVKRDQGHRGPATGHELDLECLAGIVNVYDGPNITGLQAMIRKRSSENYCIVLIHLLPYGRDTR